MLVPRPWLLLSLLLWCVPLSGLAEVTLLDNQPTTLVYPPFWHTPFGIHRGTPQLLAQFTWQRTSLAAPQDLACTLLLADQGKSQAGPEFMLTVVGANTGRGHLIYNPDLLHLDVVGDRGATRDMLLSPTGVALHANGTLYVTDPARPEVLILVPERGQYVLRGRLPAPPGGWQTPWGVALDSRGHIFVSDRGRHLIARYSPSGEFPNAIGPELPAGLRFNRPASLSVVDHQEPWSYYHDDYIFVCDSDGRRLLRLDHTGRVHKVLRAGDLTTEARPYFAWLELDYYENVWVTDSENSLVRKFDRHLQPLATYGHPGEGDGAFRRPTGIAIHRHFGQVFIAEEGGAHYFWIGTDILRAQVSRVPGQDDLASISFFLTEPARISISAAWPNETVSIRNNHRLDSGPHTLHWKLPATAADQELRFTLLAEATYSSAQHLAKRVRISLLPATAP